MKRTLFLLIIVLAVFVSSFTSVSAATGSKEIELKPTTQSEKIFKRVTLSEDNSTIVVKGEKKERGLEAYSISVDEENQTYTVTKIEDPDKLQIYERITMKPTNEVQTKETSSTLESNRLLEDSIILTYWLRVTAITDDPVGVDVNWTSQKVTWDHDGTFAYFNAREGDCNWANPSPFGTHWFNDSCTWTQYSRIDGGRTIVSDLESAYHNYDFGDDDLKTSTAHDVHLEVYGTGASDYTVTWSKSGEYSSLLDLDIYVDDGEIF